MKKSLCFIFCLFLFQLNTYSFGNDSIVQNISDWKFQRSKYLPGLRQDTLHYLLPVLTIHIGGSYGLSNGSATFNADNAPGTKVNFNNDLGFPSTTFFPRFNFIVAFTQKVQFIFDLNSVTIRKTANVPKDLVIGNDNIPANTPLKSTFNMFFINGAYRHSFLEEKHYNLGAIFGLDMHSYSLKLQNRETDVTQKPSFTVWAPFVGLDIYGFLHKDFFFRGTLNVTPLPFHNYDLTEIAFKSYLEYYFLKNVGLGVSYNYFYSNIREFSKLNGKLKYQIHSISLFATFRFQ